MKKIIFEEAGLFQGKEVNISGFLYQNDSGTWILAAEPNLKSCCIGKKNKSYIVLQGDFDSSFINKAIQVQGMISLANTEVVLENAALTKANPSFTWEAGLLLCLFVGFSFLLYKKMAKKIFKNTQSEN